MAVGLQVWSQTASNNSTSDTNINWPEGMAPSQVDDSARAMMASMAKWRDDNNGTIVTSGTTAAYTITTSQVEGALTAGYTVAFQVHATNDSSATLNVDGLGARTLQTNNGVSLAANQLLVGNIYRATFLSSGSGQWLLSSFQGTLASASPVLTTFLTTSSVTWNSTTAAGVFPAYIYVRMVGAGGGGGAANTNNGSSGTDTLFNNWSALGATGGQAGAAAGGTCGVGSNGTGSLIRRITGSSGTFGNTAGVSLGGDSGIGGGGVQAGNGTGTNGGTNSGGGGSGGTNGGQTGGGGGAGEYVEFLVTSPSTSYSIQVGAGGTGGAAGGAAGGNGAKGRIEVFAYWQ